MRISTVTAQAVTLRELTYFSSNYRSKAGPVLASNPRHQLAPERDVLMMDIPMGVRMSEIGQVEVGDFMFVGGKLRQEVSLRSLQRLSPAVRVYDQP
ncbi:MULTISPECIES: hypothetical protein [unclassified Janthinobacterium]|uniref:hypothetical protein n=1 Tax=unclassified Janthinobacterium TaxID=2610881 RepID=UPI001620D40C|nr:MULTISPECIES: hypothetical protein [unclassified Janthinobacterium]MBB5606334.1 hypothetical protein [Janthinobacterium sp. S3T4]MBB5611794.1 hypothetical protein [Janthinobacterium sp. S3M3]